MPKKSSGSNPRRLRLLIRCGTVHTRKSNIKRQARRARAVLVIDEPDKDVSIGLAVYVRLFSFCIEKQPPYKDHGIG